MTPAITAARETRRMLEATNAQGARRRAAEADGYRRYAVAAMPPRALRERAAAAISRAGAFGRIQPEALARFSESEWPDLISRWTAPTPRRSAAASAVAVFDEAMARPRFSRGPMKFEAVR